MFQKNSKQILFSGVAFAVISQVVHTAGAMLSMSYYLDPAYFPVWSRIMMPAEGAPGAEFFAASMMIAFVSGVIFAYVYAIVRKSITGKDFREKGLKYGLVLFLVGTLPGLMSLFLLINLPVGLVVFWVAEGLVVSLLGGVAIVRIFG